MRVLVSGASGLIGSALMPALAAEGHAAGRLVRKETGQPGPGDVAWDVGTGWIDAAALGSWDAVVSLAGFSVASRRWTDTVKKQIRGSRVDGARLLARALAASARPPRVLVQASAVGYYGDRGDEILAETSRPGRGFLAETCVAWEQAAAPAAARGVRVVFLRFGVVLSARGGALAKLLPPFRLGLAGRIGSGRQYMPWLALDDAVAIVRHALATDALSGPVNAVAPEQVTNAEFTRALARVLRRPAILPLPAFAARLAFGQMADEALLASQRVAPERLAAGGFHFRHPDLEPALRSILSLP
ncbi:MAG TPA: TIGR01777 family oxidoreductase [Patescibacteria group bacterium]|nr:TIGR01777 family oxidoreductase [Patescibacteria group bacterium]